MPCAAPIAARWHQRARPAPTSAVGVGRASSPARALRISRSAVCACGVTGPRKRSAGVVGDQQGREVLDVEIAERVGVVLDVDPGEIGVAPANCAASAAKVARYSRHATHHAAHRQATERSHAAASARR